MDDRALILIVEDNFTNQEVLKMIIENLNCSCTVAENGERAVEKIKTQSFDIILMDCHMPIMDGYTATKIIRDMGKPYCDIPIVAVTADVMRGNRKKCLTSGMNDYLLKPIDINQHNDKLELWVNKK